MSNVSVAITADIADLQAKLAVARANVRAFGVDMNSYANQVRVASDVQKAELMPVLQASAAGFAKAQAEAKAVQAAMGSQFHGSISQATREFRALFDELTSGRTRMTPGTLAIIGQRVLGLGPAALAASGGVLALVGALGYLVVEARAACR